LGTKLVPKSLPGGVWESPGGLREGSLSQVGSEIPLGAPVGPLLEPSWGHLGPSWSPLGASWGPLGALMGPSWAPLEPSWGHLRPSWGHLGPSWSLKGARTRNPENHRKTIGFSTFLASRVPSGSVLGVSGTVLGASCGIREASGAIVARLGGVLQVVLALWSRLGGRMGPFRADLVPEGGGDALGGSATPYDAGRGRPL